jgi:Lrp/AsnC family leucine-responsive transcriptional regulator
MIDKIDHQIISLLQENARLSNTAIAEKVGLTASTVHERVKKLEIKGVIRKYVAVIEPEALGKSITAFIRISLGSVSTDYLDAKNDIMSICQTEPDILECHGVAGEDCYILKVRTTSPQDLEKLIERIRCNAQIARSTTNIVLSTLKETSKLTPKIPPLDT